DRLVAGITRGVERVVAARVVDREGRRAGIGREVVEASGGAVEAVGRVAGTGGLRAVDGLHGIDVRHLGREHVVVGVGTVVVLREVRHHGPAPRVVGIDVGGAVGAAAVVCALMPQAKRVAGLMDVGLEEIAVVAAGGAAAPIRADVHGGVRHVAARHAVRRDRGAAAIVDVSDVGRAGGETEVDVGDVVPETEDRYGDR